jgi:hypothetical protein
MNLYRVEIAYRTKRGGVCEGMTVEAFDPDEAEEIGKKVVLHAHPARKFAFSRISTATPNDIAMGVVNRCR